MAHSTDIAAAAAALERGELVAFPTETVYGLGADATNDLAVAQVFETKGRPSFNPLIVHVSDLPSARALGRFSLDATRLAEAFWPGPLTLVVPRAGGCAVSLLASAGLDTIALRVPDHPLTLELLRRFNQPMVGPSANPSGGVSPTSPAHVERYLGDRIAMVLDGGDCRVGVESTVIACLYDTCRLLRPGGLPKEAIEKLLGQPLAQAAPGLKLHSPGLMASHYAPRAAIRLNAQSAEPGETYVGFGPVYRAAALTLSATGDLVEAAANLFRLLQAADAAGVERLAIAPIPTHGLGEAINDRLSRAAAPRPVS